MDSSPTSMDVESVTGDKAAGEGNETELRFDPATVNGMEKYQPGDKVTLTIEATMGEVGEDGKADFTVDRIEAEPMNAAKDAMRGMMGRKPNMAGTAMEDKGGY